MKKAELRQIIKEEIQSLFKNTGRLTPYLSLEDFKKKWSTDEFKKPINEMGNPLPPKDSNWYEFADIFDIGILDLDNLAADLNFRDFRDMDISITPKNLFSRDPKKFIKALKSASALASSLSTVTIQKNIKRLYS